jgi:hypothetical protein
LVLFAGKIERIKKIMSRTTENKEEILKIYGELRVINTKLDNHVCHLSKRIDTIYRIIWAVSFMALGNLLWVVKTLIVP